MLGYLIMIAFSIYLAGYGFIALFRKEWLYKIRAFSARIEGKKQIKTGELAETGTARTAMAIIALLLGLAGLVLTIGLIIIALQAQAGPVGV